MYNIHTKKNIQKLTERKRLESTKDKLKGKKKLVKILAY